MDKKRAISRRRSVNRFEVTTATMLEFRLDSFIFPLIFQKMPLRTFDG